MTECKFIRQSVVKLPILGGNFITFSKLYSHYLFFYPVMNKYETERRINQHSIDTVFFCARYQ